MADAQPQVTVAKWSNLESDEFGSFTPVAITVVPPKGTKRTPSDICCIIDISGSMGDEAKIQGAGGAHESHGLTLLDIAKHGVKTVMHTLGPEDRLSVVLFNHECEELFPLTPMDEAGVAMAEEKMDKVQPGGGTNIWSGLKMGLDVLKDSPKSGSFGHIMLLTDGQTTYRHMVLPRMQEYMQENETFPGTISTFGFGYNIDSDLLDQISAMGDATYSFIPDAGFVGTVFVNTLSNLLVTYAREVRLNLELEDCKVAKVLGDYRVSDTTEGMNISLGTLQYDQTRTIVLCVQAEKESANVGVSVSYYDSSRGQLAQSEFVDGSLEKSAPQPEVLSEYWRAQYIETIIACMKIWKENLAEASRKMSALAEAITASPVADAEITKALLQDVTGQSAEALSRQDWCKRWGQHYLPSIKFAHRVQQCNNFKDASVQVYGGELFQDIQEKADEIFNKLPAPKPTANAMRSQLAAYGTPAPAAAPVNMAQYNDRYGGCIDDSCLIQMADSTKKALANLKKGDVVESLGGQSARVVCVVKTICTGGKASLVELPGGARVTPYHPVHSDGAWKMPADMISPKERECQSICSVILEGGVALLVGKKETTPCISLGHGIKEGAARHAYFGSKKVIDDLREFPGFEEGLVELRAGDVVRGSNGDVQRLRPSVVA
mmetsp:Transcript_49595/g.105537  ORF Transcript_49595/g.105537 Transcript_49595/m.105537 type:complete len:663 (+) Transcript_49595:80-2068(+)|eukprot:CAMPEP_0206447088 /NCGR_PEP_ID=MMETSP0324_2-20121206/16557_1 /ASSEMBLY_ACC=CAM_ASM_000836 /TAXON_ID=2866 /ORGANISM="Crypthecodinium cohnii, Strain Seligo" /LENGTH=662 /DNA_ID=CAMNT_0053915751 /DNA_START=8 /DNA_END=1996 /DNA_ORIENTATION=+